jgi:prepilin-type N-terminal cleavage/methylation domain-containing protein
MLCITPSSVVRITRYPIRGPRSPRKGVTLTEVLIAMFVMALGLMGIMALFPLGAAQTANAVKDERSLQTAQVVEGHARILWRSVYSSSTMNNDYAGPFQTEPALRAFNNPDAQYANPAAQFTPAQEVISSNSGEPSFPIYFDPIGWSYQPGASAYWVGGIGPAPGQNAGGILPRRTIAPILGLANSKAAQTAATIRMFALMDDFTTFNAQGSANPVNRGGRYSAAYLIQRAFNNSNTQANLTVVVYQNRPVADTFSAETVLAVNQSVVPGSTAVAFPKAGIPSLRKGTWLLLAGRIDLPNPPNANPTHPSYAYANFYRIISVQDIGGNYQVEVSPALKDCRPPQQYWNQATYPVSIIAMDNVAEVFERPMLTPPQ